MTTRSLPNTPQTVSLPPVAPVDPKEMSFAIELFLVALRMKATVIGPNIWGIEVDDNDAPQKMIDSMPQALSKRFVAHSGRIVPRDTEVHRGAFVLLKHYNRHPLRQAIFVRTMAFHVLESTCDRNLLEQWCKRDGYRQEGPPHPALIEAVALVPTTGHGQFDTKEFFSTVERIANQKYAKAG